MKKKKFFIVISLGYIIIFLIGCYVPIQRLGSESECLGPPKRFTEADLIGTWKNSSHTDTLIIREDGTYKQIIYVDHVELPDLAYESDWQSWRLEYSDEGLPYIYLKGLNLCAAYPSLESCEHSAEKDYFWVDTCSHNHNNEKARLEDEGVLMVVGSPAPSQPPRGIQLFIMSSSEFARGYKLKEP